jgi:tRNA (cmo5U34)-methyltransferase
MTDDRDTNAEIWHSAEAVRAWAADAGRTERDRQASRQLMALLLPFAEDDEFTFCDLGAGTGAASRVILETYPRSTAVLADFSAEMMRAGERELEPFAGRYQYAEFDMSVPGDWPAGIPVTLDAVVTSLCVHHLPDERKQSLFAEILGHLVPGGWYLNYDPVLAPDALTAATWERAADRRDPEAAYRRRHRSPVDQARWENHIRYIVPLDQQLGYLRSAGFEGIDIYYKQLENVIYGGRRPLGPVPGQLSLQDVQDVDDVNAQGLGGVLAAGQVMQQRGGEQAVQDRVGGGRGERDLGPGQRGVRADDPPDHLLAVLVDLQHVGAEGLLEQALVAQVVPEPVHGRVGAQRLGHGRAELGLELGGRGRGGHDLVVPGHARGLVLAHAVRDQVFLVGEVVVQDPVREVGVLGDLPQAGPGVAELGQCLQRGVGQLRPPLGELVHLPPGDPVAVCLGRRRARRRREGHLVHVGHSIHPVWPQARAVRARHPLYPVRRFPPRTALDNCPRKS